MYRGIFMGADKRGISRGLAVMVALGWGVVTDFLGSNLRTIVVLGAICIGVSGAQSPMLLKFTSNFSHNISFPLIAREAAAFSCFLLGFLILPIYFFHTSTGSIAR
jgi:hypothetical protein